MPLPLFLGIAAAAVAGAGTIKNQVEKAKATSALIDEAEAKCKREALMHRTPRSETELQEKMRTLLFKHAFSDSDKKEQPPISSDWRHLPKGMQSKAARKYSLFTWGEYSFYTNKAVYYHCKKRGIHELLYYDSINAFDSKTGIVDYGENHEKRDISFWENFEKSFIHQLCNIWEMDDETDTSVLEFCFNRCHDFQMELGFFKTNEIRSAFRKCSKGKHGVLQKNWDHIRIVSMNDGKMEVRFWAHFPKVESVAYSDNDTEDDIREKEWKQEELIREAEERERKAYKAHETLLGLKSDIAEVFQQALYSAYGVIFKKENIAFIEEPDFTYEGPSFFDRVEGVASTAQSAYSKLADITQSRMDEARRDYERKNKG